MRAVLDVNVLVSALLSANGAPAQILRSWYLGEFELVVSEELLSELTETLRYPKIANRISADESHSIILLLRRYATSANIKDVDVVVSSRDVNDNYLIALAQVSRSNLVSGDKDLLALKGQIPVSSPSQFLELLQTN